MHTNLDMKTFINQKRAILYYDNNYVMFFNICCVLMFLKLYYFFLSFCSISILTVNKLF